jgi:hypothetical protein
MSVPRLLWAGIGCVLMVSAARADTPADPLRFLAAESDLLIKVEQPGQLANSLIDHPLFRQFRQLEVVRDLYDSTNFRRFNQMLGYVERELGMDRWKLLDELAGGGAAFAVKFGPEPAPVVLVIQGRDETLWHRAANLFLEVGLQELDRQNKPAKPLHVAYRRIDTIRLGDKLFVAIAGAALLVSNNEKGLQSALDCYLDPAKKSLATLPTVRDAHILAGVTADAWMWLNLDVARKSPGGKDIFKLPRNDVNLTAIFGGWLDVAQHAPFLSAGLFVRPLESSLWFCMPRDPAKSAPAMQLHIPPAGAAGSRPVLEPKNVLFSTSFYLDLAKIWNEREGLFNEKQRKSLETFDKDSSRVLAGSTFSKLVTLAGPYHRLVVVHNPRPGYKTTPGQNLPAAAWVVELRDPEAFAKRMEAILRAAGLLATLQVKLKQFEEDCQGHKIVGYRFVEDAPWDNDPQNLRFNASPCFVRVGNQFVFCSTVALCRELVAMLDAEGQKRLAKQPEALITRFYGDGGMQLLEYYKDVVLTQAILDAAASPKQAAQQVRDLLQFVHGLGVFQIESTYANESFRYDLRLIPAAGDQKASK